MADATWQRAFPYEDREARVTRLKGAWRVSVGAEEVEASTLIEAFEALVKRKINDAELRVVLAALA